MIEKVLDLSQIEAGRMTMSIEAVEIAPLLDEVAGLMRPADGAPRRRTRLRSPLG